MKKEKKYSDYYYLSNRKVIEVVCSFRISLLAFYSSDEVLSAQVCSLASRADKGWAVKRAPPSKKV